MFKKRKWFVTFLEKKRETLTNLKSKAWLLETLDEKIFALSLVLLSELREWQIDNVEVEEEEGEIILWSRIMGTSHLYRQLGFGSFNG